MPRLSSVRYLVAGHPGSGFHLRDVAVRAARLYQRDRWFYSLRRHGRSADRLPVRPIFVLGLQGGGTTLVSRCLLRHPDVVSMGGNSGYWVATDELGFVENRRRRLPRTLWSSNRRPDLEHPVFGDTHASVYASDELLPAYRNVAEDATEADAAALKRLVREHVAVYAHDTGRARFVDKTHTYTLKIPYLRTLLDDCDPCFVLVLRNPYSFCVRAVRRKRPSYRVELSYERQLRLAAEHWENSFRIALADGERQPGFVAVRFEDFLARPAEVVERICDVVGLPFESRLVPHPGDRMPFATLPGDRKWYPLGGDDWIGRVTPDEAAIVDERCGELARQLGYASPVESSPSSSLSSPLPDGR